MNGSIARTWSAWASCPCSSKRGKAAQTLGLTGEETYTIEGIAKDLKPKKEIQVKAIDAAGKETTFSTVVRIDTPEEVEYYRHGGILPYVLRQLVSK